MFFFVNTIICVVLGVECWAGAAGIHVGITMLVWVRSHAAWHRLAAECTVARAKPRLIGRFIL